MKQAQSIKQFCADFEISVATFYRHQADMPRVTKIGRQSRILREDLDEWIKRKRGQGGSGASVTPEKNDVRTWTDPKNSVPHNVAGGEIGDSTHGR